jgi:hypothetical protein
VSARSLRVAAPLAIAAALGACIHRGFPLGTSGDVDVRVEVAGPLFAADQVDTSGKPSGPRQDPHETGVTLYLTESGQPANGAYVDVRVDPPEALVLSSDKDEKVPTCVSSGGAFRCTANELGYARFKAASESRWSGQARLLVDWGGNTPKPTTITVLPAGLPQDAGNFQMIIGGLDESDHVLATYVPLACTIGPVPDDLGSKWRPGMIRARQAYVTATPSPTEPGALANAPVIVQSLSAEAGLALDESCADRSPRLRVLLGATGQTPPFYLCFSDNGGTIRFGVTSGAKTIDPGPQVIVDPEPRLLRVRALKSEVEAGTVPVDLFEVSAYNADRVRIAMPVDLTSSDDTVLGLTKASETLADENSPATIVQATPLAEGSAILHVSPRLFTMPDCVSPAVTVIPAPPPPPSTP